MSYHSIQFGITRSKITSSCTMRRSAMLCWFSHSISAVVSQKENVQQQMYAILRKLPYNVGSVHVCFGVKQQWHNWRITPLSCSNECRSAVLNHYGERHSKQRHHRITWSTYDEVIHSSSVISIAYNQNVVIMSKKEQFILPCWYGSHLPWRLAAMPPLKHGLGRKLR